MSEKFDSYFPLIIERILDKFHSNKQLLLGKANFIIRKLCSFQDPAEVYLAFAKSLFKHPVFNQFAIFLFCAFRILNSLV
jgi:hypothetical protein